MEEAKLTLSNDELSAVNESLQHEISLRKQLEKNANASPLHYRQKTRNWKNVSTPYRTISSPLLTIAGDVYFN